MKFLNTYFYILSILIFTACVKPAPKAVVTNLPAVKEETPLLAKVDLINVGELGLDKENLKTEIQTIPDLDSMSEEAIKNQIIYRQLLLMEAKKLGYESDPEFDEEFNTYKKIISDKLLYSDAQIDQIKEQCFKNYQHELNLSLIFMPISLYANSEDTLRLYNQLLEIRKKAITNHNFENLAMEYSKDPISTPKGGNLGWITNMQIIYPLELAAYKLSVDSISLPIRTKMGYNLLKLNSKRSNSGAVKVQHLLKYIGNNATISEVAAKEKLMDSLKVLIDAGANFNEICQRYSDDQIHNGILPPFGIGTREEPIFEETAFGLKINEVSKPIKTSNGIHILKLLEKYKPLDKNAYFEGIESKITTDSRGEYLKMMKIEGLKKSLNYSLNQAEFANCMRTFDESLAKRNWKMPQWTNNELFKIDGKSFNTPQFFEFVNDKQKNENWQSNLNSTEIAKYLFEKYVDGQLLKSNEQNMTTNNQNLSKLLYTERQDLLISKIKNDLIYQKSMSDSLGLKNFYEQNKTKFPVKEFAKVKKVSFDNEKHYQLFNDLRKKEKPYQLNRGIAPIYFTKNETRLNDEDKRRMIGLVSIMNKNPNYKVEIGGHRDINENDSTSMARITYIVDFLIENGLPLTRILEMDYKNSQPIERFDWMKNQRVTFQFFSDSEIDLIKVFNIKYPDAIRVSYEEYPKDELVKQNLKWENGNSVVNSKGKTIEYTIKIANSTKINPFYYNRAEIINAYQDFLEKELMNKLTAKYKITMDSEAVNKTINEIKKEK